MTEPKKIDYPSLPRREQIRHLLLQQRMKNMVGAALPKGLKLEPEAVLWSAISIIETPSEKNPNDFPLMHCDDLSLCRAVMQASELGLTFGGVKGDCWLLPYGGKATFQLGAYGYVTLAYRSGIVEVITDVIYAADKYRIVRGIENTIQHEITDSWDLQGGNVPYDWVEGKSPIIDPPEGRGRPLGAYAIAKDAQGFAHWEAVPEAILQQMRSVSKVPNSPAYRLWPDEMRKRSALSRARKLWPRESMIHRAIEIDERDALRDDIAEQLRQMQVVQTTGQAVSQQAAQASRLAGLPSPSKTAAEELGANDPQPEPETVPRKGKKHDPNDDLPNPAG